MKNRILVLHVAIPEINIDDWDDLVALHDEPTHEDMADVFCTEAIRSAVGITVVTLPGEKCMNDDFDVHSFDGRVVGVSVLEDGV